MVEIAAASLHVRGQWTRVKDWAKRSSAATIDRVDELGVNELRVKLRAGIDAGRWRTQGDALFASLAGDATLNDVERVYSEDMLGVRGQVHLEHYQSRLRLVLGDVGYEVALELLTQAAVSDGRLSDASIGQYEAYRSVVSEESAARVTDVLHVLEHDGYLVRGDDGYRFVSGLVEDWWRARNARGFIPFAERQI